MTNQVEKFLTEQLVRELSDFHMVILATKDFENETLNTNALSWVIACNENTLRFAVDQRSRIVQNISGHKSVTITLFAAESVYSIVGDAKIITEKMDGVPLKLSLVEVDINSVRDVMYYGSKVSQQPQFEKTYAEKAAAKLDLQVLEAMKRD